MLIEFPDTGSFSRDWLEENPERAQEMLAQCKGRYPLCRCREPGLPLYIARRSRLYLARIPNSGPQHAPHCPSYEPERSLCGTSIYSPRAISESCEGRVTIKLGVPLLIRDERGGAPPTNSPLAATENSLRESLALPGLQHLLWERSEFNRWSPGMRNRRHYRQLHRHLLETAEAVQVRRHTLNEHLYVPEPFVPDQALPIEARRQRAFRELSQTKGGAPLRILVLGKVRSVVDIVEGVGIRLAHLPNEFVIGAPREKLAKLRQTTQFAWIDSRALHPEFQLFVLLTMQRTQAGKWQLEELAGMVTTEDFIPVLSMEEALLCKRLVGEERQFYKPLPYDGAATRFPNFLLTDSGEKPIPLEIVVGSGADAAARRLRIAEYEANQQRFWLWEVEDTALPPALIERVA